MFLSDVFNLYIERSDFFLSLFMSHMFLSGVSIFFTCIFGLTLGVYATLSPRLSMVVMSFVNFLYTIPSIAMFGFLLPFLGLGNFTAIVVLVLYGILPVVKNTYTGLSEVEQSVKEAGKLAGCDTLTLLLKVEIPLAMPVIISGIRTTIVMTVSLATIASFIGADGLGVAIWRGISTNYMEMTFAGAFLSALLAISADYIMEFIEKRSAKKLFGV